GTGDDGIVLENEIGQSLSMGTEALSRLFKLFAVKGVECVVLNACYSEVQAEAISQYIKYVVGMNNAIGDKGHHRAKTGKLYAKAESHTQQAF
ncbi:MAG: hypothetical protein AAFR37_16880, partial [Cyanobacteria bacterium J06628_3]